MAKGTTVPSLYSHIAHSDDKDEMDIPQPFKESSPKQPKSRGGGKGKQPQQKLKNLPPQTQMTNTIMMILITIITVRIIEDNLEVIDPIEAKTQGIPLEAKISVAKVKEIRTHTKANIKMMTIKAIITRVIMDSIITHVETFLKAIAMDNLEVEVMAKAEVIIMAMVAAGQIIEVMLIIDIISIMVMMLSTRRANMTHLVLYAEVIITPPNIALRESMTLMILWKR